VIKNIQVRTHHKFHEAFSSWVDADVSPQSVVCIGIASHDELLFPATAAINDVPHFLSWWWFI
jgi:hypothetical protein